MAMDAGISSRVALDATALEGLKTQARQSPDKALRQAASQFEAVFMNMLMKSMRDTLGQDGPFDSQTTRMYTGMLDQQVAQTMSQRGLGLADMMVQQLSRRAAPNASAAANAGDAAGAPARGPPANGE
jgi:flagellar protein FlgJ